MSESNIALPAEPSTPLMRQYAAVKKQHPTALVFFRLGDFYELFFEDAVVAAKELQITLTSRNKEKGAAVPMCGVPYHAAEGYLAKLIRKGYKVAICEQIEEAAPAKPPGAQKPVAQKLVRREVTRVLTPGTAADATLGAEENNFLAAVVTAGERAGFAALDLSTGEFRATEFTGENALSRVEEELEQLRPRELLYASSAPLWKTPLFSSGAGRSGASTGAASTNGVNKERRGKACWAETPLDDWIFSADHAIPLVENHFGVLSLEGFGLAGRPAAAAAAGAILYYVRSTQRGTLDHVDRIGWYERQSCLVLDAVTVRNLELIEPVFTSASHGGGAGPTLYRAIDRTVTPMGKRLLRAWLLRPAIDLAEINARLDAVEAAVKGLVAREELRRGLDGVLDLERLLSRVTLETANPRDLLALAGSLGRIPGIKTAAKRLPAGRFRSLDNLLDELGDVRTRVEQTIVAEPPLNFSEGGVIRAAVDRELDDLRDLSRNSKQVVAQIEQRERARTGIASLKVKFNSIFGYYLEVSKPNLHLVPADYERKQTLVGAERFTMPELKEYEAKILDAEAKTTEIERRIFLELRRAIASESKRIRQTALALAEIDVLAALGELAAHAGYSRPEFSAGDEGSELQILAGRHPVIEMEALAWGAASEVSGSARFVPNDLYLNASTHNILLVTGPNMGGKSTYLRQTALIVILGQMGSFVPAQAARLPVVDRIFTRIGASDNLAQGRSTFMVEMTETAAILHTATPKSLILLDEVGRGTATYDGLALAWAAVEYLDARVRAKTLFATHYFELTELADRLPGVKNYHVAVRETVGGIAFLRKVEPGAADRSYGIEVAKLAGLPVEVVERARVVLAEHERAERDLAKQDFARRDLANNDGAASRDSAATPLQLTIFTPLSQPVIDKLRTVDLNRLTPLEALNLLAELKKQIE
jgi:DNA mismatch repair protein MutS